MDNEKRAAILLLGMGEEAAAEILKHLSQKQVEKLINVMNELGSISDSDLIRTLNAFYKDQGSAGLSLSTKDYIRNTLMSAVGTKKAESLIENAKLGESARGLEILCWQPARVIVELIEDEHPQVIALVLTYLDSEKAAEALKLLPDDLRPDILKRITSIGPISPIALEDLSEVIEEQVTHCKSFKTLPIGGVDATANIVNFLDSEMEHDLMNNINEEDEELANEIQDRMFPFEKLAEIDTRSLQTLLRDVSNDDLVLALKGIDPSVQDVFFKNMSERAAMMIRDDLKVMGPVQLTKVVNAQRENYCLG
jgi:flagellar motor switch protein FliG